MPKIYQVLASTFNAYKNCIAANNTDWKELHANKIENIMRDNLPHGSGFDAGCTFDFDKSKVNNLVINFDYHKMDDNGFYAGWYGYRVFITPSLANGFELRIVGPNKEDKPYFYETLGNMLDAEYPGGENA